MTTGSQRVHEVVIDRNVVVPMRDGTRLMTDVYRPRSPERFPVILERTPYDKTASSESRVERLEIDLWATSYVFKTGHRVRVAVTSSCFPRWDRNMNTGGDNAREASGVIAINTVFHHSERPSHVVLPVRV